MTRTRSLLVCILTLGALTASVASAQACTKTWSGGSGNWSEASHWGGKIPESGDEACINSGTVQISGEGADVKSLTVASGVTLDVIGTSYIHGGETQNVTQLFAGSASFATGSHLLLEATEGGAKSGTEPKGAGAFLVGGSIAIHGALETKSSDPAWADRIKVSALKIEPGAAVSVDSGTLKFIQEGEGGYPWSATNEGTFTVAPGAAVEMQPSFAGSATFTNAGSLTNSGSIVGYGANWVQTAGSVSGNPVVLDSSSTLTDSGGTGSFLGAYQEITVTGTIPAGQTVTVKGEPFNSDGENYYSTALSTGGKELINDGTLILNPTGEGSLSGGQVSVGSGSIHNNGTIAVTTETPTRLTLLEEGLTNGPFGRLEINGGILQGNPGGVTNEGLVTLAPTAAIQLEEGGAFVNKGTFSPEIAGASSFGAVQLTGPCCNGPGNFTAGGTLAPVLLGGFVPAAGQEFDVFGLDGGKFEGTFPGVGNGFSADYSHESSEPAFVGAIYGASAGSTGGPGTGVKGPAPTPTPVAQVGLISGGHGNLTVALSCPAGGGACPAATVQATVTEHLKGSKITAISAKKKKSAAKTKQVVIASGGASLAAGTSETLTLKLNGAGSALLAKYGKLTAKVNVSAGGKTLDTAAVTVQKAKKPKQKK